MLYNIFELLEFIVSRSHPFKIFKYQLLRGETDSCVSEHVTNIWKSLRSNMVDFPSYI